VSQIYSSLLIRKKCLWDTLHLLLQALPRVEKVNFFDAMLRDLAKKYLSTGSISNGVKVSGIEYQARIGGVAAIINGVISEREGLESYLVGWLTDTSGEYATLGLDIRRAVIATLAQREGSYDSTELSSANTSKKIRNWC
jgi:hypothetical protein